MDKSSNTQWLPLKSILLIQDQSLARKLICQNLEAFTGASIQIEYNATSAIEVLQGQVNFDLVICQNQIEEENTALKVYYTLVSQKLKTPLIVLGENPKIANEAHCMDAAQWKKIIKKAAELMGLNSEIMANWKTSDYYPFPINRLSFLKKAPFDLYLQLQQKIFCWKKKDEAIDVEEVVKKVTEGHHYFFIEKDLRLKFTNFFTEHIQAQNQSENQNYHDILGSASSLFQASIDSIKNHGLTSESIELCKLSIDQTIYIAQNSPELELLLQDLETKSPDGFIKRNLLLSIIGHQCLELMNIKKVNEHQIRHCFAAFFHDLIIPNEKLSSILNLEDLEREKGQLNRQELQDIQNHAFKMANILKDQKGVPPGTAHIILNHHASPDGKGLTSNEDMLLDYNMNTALFIIVERLINEALKIGGDIHHAYHSIVHFNHNDDQKSIVKAIKKLIEKPSS